MRSARFVLFFIIIMISLFYGCQKTVTAPEAELWLGEAKPNPMQEGAETSITYWVIDSDQGASLLIINSLGQRVYCRSIPAGSGSITWNGRDSHDRICAEGVYYYQLRTSTSSLTNKLFIAR